MRIRKSISFSWQIILIIILMSCKSGDKHPLLPSVTGKPGALAIVIDKSEWDSEVGDSIRNVFEQPFQVIPQYEPIFDAFSIPHSAFNNVMLPQRNIIIVNIDSKYDMSKITVQRDVYADSQIIIDMFAKNDSAFIKLFDENQKKIIGLLEDVERKRLQDHYKFNLDEKIYKDLRSKRNLSLLVPKGFKISIDTTNFVWLYQDIETITLGILIYEYNYTDTNTFTLNYLVNKRNQFVNKYVEGEVDGSYMTTEREFGPFLTQYMLNGTRYVAEMRGLWKMENGISMGGPFISITTLDEKRNRIVTVEGFVFAAGKDKRNYVRQVDAIVLSLEIL